MLPTLVSSSLLAWFYAGPLMDFVLPAPCPPSDPDSCQQLSPLFNTLCSLQVAKKNFQSYLYVFFLMIDRSIKQQSQKMTLQETDICQ